MLLLSFLFVINWLNVNLDIVDDGAGHVPWNAATEHIIFLCMFVIVCVCMCVFPVNYASELYLFELEMTKLIYFSVPTGSYKAYDAECEHHSHTVCALNSMNALFCIQSIHFSICDSISVKRWKHQMHQIFVIYFDSIEWNGIYGILIL